MKQSITSCTQTSILCGFVAIYHNHSNVPFASRRHRYLQEKVNMGHLSVWTNDQTLSFFLWGHSFISSFSLILYPPPAYLIFFLPSPLSFTFLLLSFSPLCHSSLLLIIPSSASLPICLPHLSHSLPLYSLFCLHISSLFLPYLALFFSLLSLSSCSLPPTISSLPPSSSVTLLCFFFIYHRSCWVFQQDLTL